MTSPPHEAAAFEQTASDFVAAKAAWHKRDPGARPRGEGACRRKPGSLAWLRDAASDGIERLMNPLAPDREPDQRPKDTTRGAVLYIPVGLKLGTDWGEGKPRWGVCPVKLGRADGPGFRRRSWLGKAGLKWMQ